MTGAEALARSHPDELTTASAALWLDELRARLTARAHPLDTQLAVSSGCAASGARTHSQDLARDAAHALARWDAGLGAHCERCGDVLPLERFAAAPAAVRCVGCARPYAVDTRWCR